MVKSLQELGIPDYSQEEFLALDDFIKFTETLRIRDDGENLDSPVLPEETEQCRSLIKSDLELTQRECSELLQSGFTPEQNEISLRLTMITGIFREIDTNFSVFPTPEKKPYRDRVRDTLERTQKEYGELLRRELTPEMEICLRKSNPFGQFQLPDEWESRLDEVKTKRDLFYFLQSIHELHNLVYKSHDGRIYSVDRMPYFTNNFFAFFMEFGPENMLRKKPRNQKSNDRKKEYSRVFSTLFALLAEDNFSVEEFKIKDRWERERAAYPYYITLRREYHADKIMLWD